MEYQVIIIGGGPAGIFAGLTLARRGIEGVVILEQGRDIHDRQRLRAEDLLRGWGGAGAFSDGKLTLSPEVGGSLGDYLHPEVLTELLEATDRIYAEHGAPDRVFGGPSPALTRLAERARRAGLAFVPSRIRHMGTDHCGAVMARMRETLADRVEVRTGCAVESILAEGPQLLGVRLANGEILHGRYVIAAPGRSGAQWMKEQAQALKLRTKVGPVDIGVRVELPAVVLDEITEASYESKLIYYSKGFDDKIRTFCMNPYGEVVAEKNGGLVTVNGHSYAERRSPSTNFALLVSNSFTEPFDDPIAYGRSVAQLANLLGKGVIVQRLADLLAGRRSTPARLGRCLTRPTLAAATPGDLSFVFPYRQLTDILEMLRAMDRLAPGVYAGHTLLYGVEVKFYSNRIEVSRDLETALANLFTIGDGAGLTRGLLQASASGIVAAGAIAARLGSSPEQ